MELKEKLAILEVVLPWSKQRIDRFKIWEYDELVNEGYIHAVKIYPKWNPKKGPLRVYFESFLYDHVFRSYAKQHDIEIKRDRSGGTQGKRIYTPKMHYTANLKDVVDEQVKKENVPWDLLSEMPRSVAYLLGVGLSKAQTGRVLGVSGSRISQLALEIKSLMKENRRGK